MRHKLQQKQEDLAAIENVQIPKWTQGFRTFSRDPLLLSLPGAYKDLLATLNQELRDNLDAWKRKQAQEQKWGFMHPTVATITKDVHENPDEIRQIEGMTDELFQELVAALKNKGHLRD